MESLKRTAAPAQTPTKKANTALAGKVVLEADVGVTQYVNPATAESGFFGTVKQRYADFQVFEVSLEGSVAHLTDRGVDVPSTKKDRRGERRQNQRDGNTVQPDAMGAESAEQAQPSTPKYQLSDAHRARLLEYVTAEDLSAIEGLFLNGGNMETATTFPVKTQRTQLHQLLRQAFQGKLETFTSPENTFRIALAKTKTATRRNNDVNHVDEAGVVNFGLGPFKNYLHFTVYKENRETMEIASIITKFLRVPGKAVRYAGTKDRRGVTCQHFCIHKGKVARVNSLAKGLNGAILGLFAYKDRGLGLGDLQGNEFHIAIRDVKTHGPDSGPDALAAVVLRSFESLREKGFINYFGLQRFGTFSISTHVLGIHLLKDEWANAAELILAEQDRILPESMEARRVWTTLKDAAAAARLMPRRCLAEHNVLTQLAKEKKVGDAYPANAYFKAIMQIPRNLRLIYVHAYQSYVWNLVVSRRFELFGLEVQEGDLVIVEEKNADGKLVTEIVDGEEFAEDVAGTPSDKVRALTASDVALGNYTIYEVVLPTPGYDVTYPANPQLMEVYEKVMTRDGLDPHKMARRVKEFLLAGLYRAVMMKPTNLSYEILKYTDAADPILRTDLEILAHKEETSEVLDRVVQSTDPAAERTAVVLKMRLGVSSYATMALREFMRADTSRFSVNFDVKVDAATVSEATASGAPVESEAK
ncbi:tRNA pseudouridine synthase D [Metschnikowia bicuspidata]|uniref:tRNA pseudouridine synthase D n=1 Tax=Metschnikowia bicuspidata TaxID=27322 RepID=A0A4P9ZBB4_9ASCO|nr:tRNA pseudouridine synthase D [Metschnikowia bicuspidata]